MRLMLQILLQSSAFEGFYHVCLLNENIKTQINRKPWGNVICVLAVSLLLFNCFIILVDVAVILGNRLI